MLGTCTASNLRAFTFATEQKKTTNSNNWGERTKSLVGPTGTMKRTMKLC